MKSATDVIKAVLLDLGKPRGLRFESGPTTARGTAWQNITTNYAVLIEPSDSAAKIVEKVVRARRAAMMQLEAFMWKKFLEEVGDEDPAGWEIVGLEGQWHAETVMPPPVNAIAASANLALVHVDRTCAFERTGEKPSVEPAQFVSIYTIP